MNWIVTRSEVRGRLSRGAAGNLGFPCKQIADREADASASMCSLMQHTNHIRSPGADTQPANNHQSGQLVLKGAPKRRVRLTATLGDMSNQTGASSPLELYISHISILFSGPTGV